MMITKNKNILISGASIAGPTLAYWLKRYGFTPTVIERAPQLREGGYPIDVRYEAVQVAKLMGIWSRLQQEKTNFSAISFVNERHQVRFGRFACFIQQPHVQRGMIRLPHGVGMGGFSSEE
jgi:2-polyprenyl-6-methoxyphenol hydroxylase-like FAD-dependent oxidoreductase